MESAQWHQEERELSLDTAWLEGVAPYVEIFEDDRFRFRLAPLGAYEAGVPVRVVPMDTILEGGEWRIEPKRLDLEPIGSINL